jgi:ABC-type sugar transport system permease subunit
VTQLVQVLKVFDIVFVMTGGGPAGLSRTLALLFYEQTFTSLNPQYGAAVVVVMSILIILTFSITRRVGEEAPDA